MPTSHIAIRHTIFSTKVSKLIYFPSLIMPNCLITFIQIHNWLLSELNQLVTVLGFLCVYFVTWSYDVNLVIRVYLDRFCNYVSPSNKGRHIVLVWFFLLLLLLLLRFCFFSAKLVRTITFLSFQIGQLYLVCGCMTIRQCVTYHNDLCETLTFDLKVKLLFFK